MAEVVSSNFDVIRSLSNPVSAPSSTTNPAKAPTTIPTAVPPSVHYISGLLPRQGSSEGGYVVRVKGGNFFNGTVACFFSEDLNIEGRFISDTELSCLAPMFNISQYESVGGRQLIEFFVTIDGKRSTNAERFEFYGACPVNTCNNGYCVTGKCICFGGFSGQYCNVTIESPIFLIAPEVEVVTGQALNVTPVLVAGSFPITWTVTSVPSVAGLFISYDSGIISWNSTRSTTRKFRVVATATNYLGNYSQVVDVSVLPQYYIANLSASETQVATGPSKLAVSIEGICVDRQTNLRVPFCRAEIFIEKLSLRRVVLAVGNSEGVVQIRFVPNPNEGGIFQFGGQVPGFQNATNQGSFSIFGFYVNPEIATSTVTAGNSATNMNVATVYTVDSTVTVTGLSIEIQTNSLPPEISVLKLKLLSTELSSSVTSIEIEMEIIAIQPVETTIAYRVLSDSGAYANGTVAISVRDAVGRLSVDSFVV